MRGDSLDVISPGEASYLGGEGKLSSRAGQVGLRRIVDAYERALNLFPTYYPLWSTYLSLRSEYVLGTAGKTLQLNKPRSKYATERNMNDFLRAGKDDQVKEIEDGERDVESEWKEGEAVGGVLGFEEWKSLVAVHERALMVFPRVSCSSWYHTDTEWKADTMRSTSVPQDLVVPLDHFHPP